MLLIRFLFPNRSCIISGLQAGLLWSDWTLELVLESTGVGGKAGMGIQIYPLRGLFPVWERSVLWYHSSSASSAYIMMGPEWSLSLSFCTSTKATLGNRRNGS